MSHSTTGVVGSGHLGSRENLSTMTEPTDRHPVEALAEEYIARQRRGERPTVTEYVERYPQWAEDIRDLFPTAALLEDLKASSPQSALGQLPEHLGDFRILREIGRGGMGIVYEAEQVSLGRHVALKVLPQTSLSAPGQVARFRREAQAAGRLHHTNIVPVFGVGEQDGLHYYVMQYIQGEGLDRLIARLAAKATPTSHTPSRSAPSSLPGVAPTELFPADDPLVPNNCPVAQTATMATSRLPSPPFPTPGTAEFYRAVARLMVQVAEALAYAHEQGVLHRDIKPANLLLDEQGVVWITDFGLAKLLEEADLTRSGELAGTLRYCAPERFQGRSDARSDLYALGLTFYELLTLRPAYGETDPSKLLPQLLQGRYTRPRLLAPQLPSDLETVLLKLLAPEPERRYANAAELAEDLHLFLADRPVRARRANVFVHLTRWCRRNPAVASLSLALLVSVLLGYVLVGWKWREAIQAAEQARIALANEELERIYAEEQRHRAEGNLNLALEAFDSIASGLALGRPAAALESDTEEPVGPGIGVVSPEAAAILQDLVRFYERFATENVGDPRLQQGAAQALRLVGSIRFRLAEYPAAEIAFRRAAELLRELEQPLELAQVHNDLGVVLRSSGRLPAARIEHERAAQLLTGDDDPAARLELARAYNLQGVVELRTLRFAQAEKSQRAALKLLEQLVGEESENPAYRHTLARVYNDLSIALLPRDRAESLKARNQAQTLLEKLVAEFPSVPEYQADLIELLIGTAPRPTFLIRPRVELESRYQQAVRLAENLAGKNPNTPDYQALYARARTRLGQIQLQGGKISEALDNLQRSVELHASLVRRYPSVPIYQMTNFEARLTLGEVLRQKGDLASAEKVLRELKQDVQKLPSLSQRSVFGRSLMVGILRSLAQTLQKQGKKQEAEQLFKQADKLSGWK